MNPFRNPTSFYCSSICFWRLFGPSKGVAFQEPPKPRHDGKDDVDDDDDDSINNNNKDEDKKKKKKKKQEKKKKQLTPGTHTHFTVNSEDAHADAHTHTHFTVNSGDSSEPGDRSVQK